MDGEQQAPNLPTGEQVAMADASANANTEGLPCRDEASPAKFTPGPWTVDKTATVRNTDGWIIAEVLGGGKGIVEMHPNGRLIAAAPEMYEALKAIDANWKFAGLDPDSSRSPAHFTDRTIQIWRSIRSAIAKAEGRTA